MTKITTVLQQIQSRLVAPKSQRNTFGNYNYRSCEDILNALKPLLAELSAVVTLSDEMVLIGDRIYVKATAVIITESDHSEKVEVSAYAREPFARKGMDDAQVTGATSSYARKYALNGLFAIDDTKDADHGPPPQQQQQRTQAPPPKKTRTTAERVAGACKAYGECSDSQAIRDLDEHLPLLLESCNGEQQTQIATARDWAVARSNEGAN
jgi:hypothetical protein